MSVEGVAESNNASERLDVADRLDVPGTAVVTGGASGIGLALARGFVERGWSVAIADVDAEATDRAVGLLQGLGAEVAGESLSSPGLPSPSVSVIGEVVDVGDSDAVEAFAARIDHVLGTPRVVCNNAGVNAYGFNSWDAPPSTWEWIWRVNVMGVVNGIRTFVPRLLRVGRGRIVNTASIAGLASAPGVAPYAASKHAIVAISESLRDELALIDSQVGVSVVCPSLVATNIGASARHWPAELGAVQALGPAAHEYTNRLEAARSAAPDPQRVADATFDAIAGDRFLVLVDPDDIAVARVKRNSIFDQLGELPAPTEWF